MKKLLVFLGLMACLGCGTVRYRTVIDCDMYDAQKRKVVVDTPYGKRTYWSTPCGGGVWKLKRTKPVMHCCE